MYRIGAHKYVLQYCGDPVKPECPMDEIVSFSSRRSCTIKEGNDTDHMIEDKNSFLSVQLNEVLAKNGLKRIKTQNKITNPPGSHFSDVAPILDVLCVNKKGKCVPIEIKTGKSRRIRKKNKNDKGATGKLKAFADTVALRHHAQLAVQIECLRNPKWNGAGSGFLVYIDPMKVKRQEVLNLKLVSVNKDVLDAISK